MLVVILIIACSGKRDESLLKKRREGVEEAEQAVEEPLVFEVHCW